jgi:hypothetical protein
MRYDTEYILNLQRKYYCSLEELHLQRNKFTEVTSEQKDQINRFERRDDKLTKQKRNATIRKLRSELKELKKTNKQLENKFTDYTNMLSQDESNLKKYNKDDNFKSSEYVDKLRQKLINDNKIK